MYDLTSSYFCRRSSGGKLRRHGRSKDGKPRQVQVLLGVVMANGWPIAHHVFAANTAEKTTLIQVLSDLERRLGLGRVMVVADRGAEELNIARWLSSPCSVFARTSRIRDRRPWTCPLRRRR